MPANVKTRKDEKLWEKAKKQTKKQKPGWTEDDDRFWAYTMSIYEKMKKGKKRADLLYKYRTIYSRIKDI